MILQKKIALVTGGAVRIGRSICEMLAQEGAEVYCHYNHSAKEARQLQNALAARNLKIQLVQGDFANIKIVERVVRYVIKRSGKLDILINNAAVFFKMPLGTVKEKEWDLLFAINLKAAFFCAQIAGMQMVKQSGGKIINIGDAAGDNPWSSYIPYGITKSGIIAMTKGLAKALAPNVHVNCINPGPVSLPKDFSEKERRMAVGQTVLNREGSAQDIAAAVKFLLKDSDYITGAVITVDGGRSIH
jgi:pteridine reductase